ncbi:MAG: hypothetical protein AAEJ52_10600 [Myxococcota bacterium]
MGRSVAALVCFALGLVVVGGVVRSLVPWPSDMSIADRVEHLREHPAAYDTLFFGSSHFYRSFVPEVVDSELANRGHAIRSFNMGTPGMSVFEMDFLIRQVLEQPESSYRWIIFEYSFYPFEYPDRITSPFNYFKDRVVFWHTPGRTWDVVRAMADSSLNVDHKLAGSWAHTLHGLWRFGSVGQGERIVASLFPSPQIADGDYRRTRGYEPLERGAGISGLKERKLFLETPGPFLEMVAKIDALNRRKLETDQLELRPLRSLQEAIRASGARPVVAIPAIPNATPALFSLEPTGEIETLIALNSPKRFPGLYRTDRRFDGLHLNELGAREHSREFARLFSGVLDEAEK